MHEAPPHSQQNLGTQLKTLKMILRGKYSEWELPLQDAQLSQRDRAAGCVIVFAKSRRLHGTGRQYFTDIIGLSSTTVI